MDSASSKKARLRTYLAEVRPAEIDTKIASKIAAELAPISPSYLRKLLITAGYPLSALVEGANLTTLEDLERTLLALAGVYESTDAHVRSECRRRVIEAKEKLRWASRRSSEDDRRNQQQEMLLWVSTWLENPDLFEGWLRLRRRTTAVRQSAL